MFLEGSCSKREKQTLVLIMMIIMIIIVIIIIIIIMIITIMIVKIILIRGEREEQLQTTLGPSSISTMPPPRLGQKSN